MTEIETFTAHRANNAIVAVSMKLFRLKEGASWRAGITWLGASRATVSGPGETVQVVPHIIEPCFAFVHGRITHQRSSPTDFAERMPEAYWSYHDDWLCFTYGQKRMADWLRRAECDQIFKMKPDGTEAFASFKRPRKTTCSFSFRKIQKISLQHHLARASNLSRPTRHEPLVMFGRSTSLQTLFARG